jgi:hypothetical protein
MGSRTKGRLLRRESGLPEWGDVERVMRYDTTPGFSLIDQFRNHCPADAKIAALWAKSVKSPMDFAIEVVHPILGRNSRLDEVFHFQVLPELLDGLALPSDTAAARNGSIEVPRTRPDWRG